MKVLVKGFNLYHQLNNSSPLIKDFIETFQNNGLESLEINHTYSLTKHGNTLTFYSTALSEIYKLTSLNLCTLISDSTNVCKISSDDEKILLLTDTGQVYKFLIDNECAVQGITKFWDSEDKIERIVSSSKLNVATSIGGFLFNIPNKLDTKIDVADIKLGKEHCIILDKCGNVYSFGRGSRGQLGHGNLEDLSEPLLIEALGGIKVIKIAAGGWHSCAISASGDLYTWGLNVNGQLGLGSQNSVSVMALPHCVDFETDEIDVVNVVCGYRHTLALLGNGKMYGCGWNKYKQVLNEETESYSSFINIYDLSKETVLDLICGPWNSCVICR